VISPLVPNYARVPLAFERGEGSWLVTRRGERYLDFGSGIAVNNLGHAHPRLVEALKAQAEKLWHVSNIFEIPEGERLAQRLADKSFADQVMFCNSGAEANEAAIKMARRYHYLKGQPERYRILTFENAFHGRTLGTIAAGGQAKYLEGFGPKAEGFDQVPFGDHEAMRAAVTPQTAAIMIEPIQGEGGVRSVPHVCLRGLRELCDETGMLLIYDEVQTGFGRTGKLFGHEWSGVAPDIMAVAKALGGGFPVGAVLATADAATGLTAGSHGTTFGGNPLAMAVGNAVLDVMEEPGFFDHVNHAGLVLRQRLAELGDRFPDIIAEIRGTALMTGLRLNVPNADFVAATRDQHLLCIPAGDNVVRLYPPLTISEADLLEGVKRIEAACIAMQNSMVASAKAGAST
jgi:acetylornithine/N-succinyldiaminopimelate aminotransferase